MGLPYENATSGDKALGDRAHNFKNLSGQIFGKWTVLHFDSIKSKWLCRCECGREALVRSAQLNNGRSTRCKSCANRGRAHKHGLSSITLDQRPRKYRAWLSMLGRVRDSNSPRSRWYKDVTLCEEWEQSFEAFNRDVPDPPSDDLTLDRIDNRRGYEPGNVRWVSMKEQARNRRSNRLVRIGDRVQCLAAWEEETGIQAGTISYRVKHGLHPLTGRKIDE